MWKFWCDGRLAALPIARQVCAAGQQALVHRQKQRWFLLRLLGTDDRVKLDLGETPEFDRWRWVDFWRPVNEVIYFKRRVYSMALHELGPHVYPQGLPPRPRWWPKRWRVVFDKDLARAKKASQLQDQ